MQLRLDGFAKRGVLSRYLVINALRQERLSRAHLARRFGLSPAAVTAICDELIRQGIIREDGYGRSSRGRRPVLLNLRQDAAYAVGIDLTQAGLIRAALLNLSCELVTEYETSIVNNSPEAVVDGIVSAYKALVSQAKVQEQFILGVGITSPGPVDYTTGMVQRAVLFDWREVPLCTLVSERLGKPAYIDLDVNIAAIGEFGSGDFSDTDDIAFITVGAGIASSFIIKGEVIRRPRTSIGELGHCVVQADGELCECGSHGCLETMASQRAMVRWFVSQRQAGVTSSIQTDNVSADDIYSAALSGDALARQAVDRVAYYVGIAVSNIINLFSPTVITIGGAIWPVMSIFLPVLVDTAKQNSLPELVAHTKIQPSRLGTKAEVIGAGALVLEEAFRVPTKTNKEAVPLR